MELENINEQKIAKDIRANLELILMENTRLIEHINFHQVAILTNCIRSANHIFITAAGRSGFAMRSAAMRLMHLGHKVYFVGETTTPAILKGDLLIAASGSGTTSTIVKAAQKAREVGAIVVSISTQEESSLSLVSNQLILVPAAGKQDLESKQSAQYAGSLFEQFILLLTDSVFQSLWKLEAIPAAELWKRHANLE